MTKNYREMTNDELDQGVANRGKPKRKYTKSLDRALSLLSVVQFATISPYVAKGEWYTSLEELEPRGEPIYKTSTCQEGKGRGVVICWLEIQDAKESKHDEKV